MRTFQYFVRHNKNIIASYSFEISDLENVRFLRHRGCRTRYTTL